MDPGVASRRHADRVFHQRRSDMPSWARCGLGRHFLFPNQENKVGALLDLASNAGSGFDILTIFMAAGCARRQGAAAAGVWRELALYSWMIPCEIVRDGESPVSACGLSRPMSSSTSSCLLGSLWLNPLQVGRL